MSEKMITKGSRLRAGGLSVITMLLLAPALGWAADEPPPGVEQLLPRGGIPAIFEPQFVAAKDAKIPVDAWVLGVAIEGEARAYSLNLLNRHEVVNDRFGDLPVAAVW